MKPVISALSLGLGLAVASPAFAVPDSLKCPEGDLKATDCVRDDVFILNGSTPGILANPVGDPLRVGCQSGSIRDLGLIRWNCYFDHKLVADRFLEILKSKNIQSPQWDELVIFAIDSDQAAVFGGNTEPMLFYRTGGAKGVNEVEGIGLEKKPRDPAIPFTGYVTGGSTTTFGIWNPPYGKPIPKTMKWWPLPDPAGVQGQETRYLNCGPRAYCNDGFNGYQALAQVSSHLYGPYLKEETELLAEDNWYAFSGQSRSLCSPKDPPTKLAVPYSFVTDGGAPDAGGMPGTTPKLVIPTGGLELLDLSKFSGTKIAPAAGEKQKFGEPALSVCPNNKTNLVGSINPPQTGVFDPVTGVVTPSPEVKRANYGKLRPRIWNSFMDMDGSLMGGGANWVENGNYTATSGGPNAFQVASPPYRGRRMVVFHPLELWLMGFAPANDVIVDVLETKAQDMLGRQSVLGYYTGEAGPRMGLPQLIAIGTGADPLTIYSDSRRQPRTIKELLGADPKRVPDFAEAPHKLKQLWLVITKPEDKILAKDDTTGNCMLAPGDDKDKKACSTGQERLDEINADGIEHMIRWRRAWQQQFYMLSGYRGRMVANFDQTFDDSAYWEFLQKADDTKTFTPAGGLSFEVSGPRRDLTSPTVLSYANISTPGREGTMTFTSHSQQLPTRIDGRIKERVWAFSPENKKFVVAGDNALLVRMALPKRDPDEAKNIKASALLQLKDGPEIRIPGDTKVDPANPRDTKSYLVFDGKFHTYAVDLRKYPDFKDKTFDGFTFVPSTVAVTCDPAVTAKEEDESLDCIKLDYLRFANVPDPDDAGDYDLDCDGKEKPDGYIGLEDNCPKLWNPGQEDADGNGVGDDCEDFDLDAIVNKCDNCPTLTNARQGDRDDDRVGDICDEDFRGGCFLQPDSVAGSNSGNPAVIPLALLGLSLAGVFAFRMKRRRKR